MTRFSGFLEVPYAQDAVRHVGGSRNAGTSHTVQLTAVYQGAIEAYALQAIGTMSLYPTRFILGHIVEDGTAKNGV